MAGWSILADDESCTFDYFEIQKNGLCLDLDAVALKMGFDGEKDVKLRSIFDQILLVFLERICLSKFMRPLPPMLGDGRVVDLYKLFMVVRTKGGYDSVTKNVLWSKVAEEIGLDSGVGSAVKLSYFKYLYQLDRWLVSFSKDKGRAGGGGLGLAECDGSLGLLPTELEKEFKSLLSAFEKPNQLDTAKNEKLIQVDSAKNDMRVFSVEENMHHMNEVTSVAELGGDKKRVLGGDLMVLDPSVVDESVSSRKRKREDLSGMLDWIVEIAKDPSDATIGKFVEASKQKTGGGQDFYGFAMLARNALLQKEYVQSSEENSHLQKKQKMHPSMYEDEVSGDRLSTERSRSSQRLSEKDSCLQHESSNKDRSVSRSPPEKENHQSLNISDSLNEADKAANPFDEDQFRKQVPVGSLHQAEVPEWTGTASESDSKWLGTQHWPLITENQKPLIERESIGKGRQNSCDCQLPGSVECVRFHIAENKMRLKLELGTEAFYRWRFHHMGEEVSLQWTRQEEKKFKDIVRLNPPSLGKCFWNQAFRCFRTKSKKTLVSYYFNVFVLRHRCYQNRVTPKNIDSDDDESEFGSVSNDFGHERVKVPNSSPIVCSQNYQCTALD